MGRLDMGEIMRLAQANKQFDFNTASGIILDIGCGDRKLTLKNRTVVGMDIRPLENVDIVHNIESIPWPIPDNSCLTIIASHILEHIKPWLTIDIFNELWRIMKSGGQLAISLPYGGSHGFYQDPTHINGFNEDTFRYFDPEYPNLYNIYKPSPWKIQTGFPVWQSTGNMEVIMNKINIEEIKEADTDVTT